MGWTVERATRTFALAMVSVLALLLVVTSSARADITEAFDGQLDCTPANADGTRDCNGVIDTFTLSPLDVNLKLPPQPASGPDGNFPIIGVFHGWGGSKVGGGGLKRWTDLGFAAFSMSDRGWGNSCGVTGRWFPARNVQACNSPFVDGQPSSGYNHLMDTRYEVRDAQEAFGLLADDGIIDPQRIGATGSSYGGGISMALASLKDRKMLQDGSLIPWTSPGGLAMEIAGAAPDIPWTDLAYSLVPNGRMLDYAADNPYLGPEGAPSEAPFGVMKQSYVTLLYGAGVALSNFSAPRTDPSADVHGWYSLLSAGEPYQQNPLALDVAKEVSDFHSSYNLAFGDPEARQQPAPLLISNGWTDDLFPPDEAIRFYNRTRDLYPDADISMMFLDHGHARGQNKGADTARLGARQEAWLAHHVGGQGPEPSNAITLLTQECGADSLGPFTAPTWAEVAPGEIRFESAEAKQIAPQVSNPEAGQAYDPVAAGTACSTVGADDVPGLASYRLPPAPAGGFTLMGSPTIIADIQSLSPTNQVAARLLDVDPGGDQTLVARGVYRPDLSLPDATRQVFQLHPNGYRFEEGHVAKLELAPHDQPTHRQANGQGPIAISNLDLRLPVLEAPGTAGAAEPAPRFLPEGYEIAADLAPEPLDGDGDGFPDETDACPDEPGPGSADGCPPPPVDTDLDGTPDSTDPCPADPGPATNNGCPVTDGDGDGIADDSDDCPADPGPASNSGCPVPDPDRDGDGVPDAEDVCPDTSGPATTHGCPPDRDFDGVEDAEDGCPDNPGPASSAGCPLDSSGGPVDDGAGPSVARCSNRLTGTARGDRMTGTNLGDRIIGGDGDDRLKGRGGDDCVVGQDGQDRVNGGRGEDRLRGGKGRDRLNSRDGQRDVVNCGKGRDRARVDQLDVVRGCEKIRLKDKAAPGTS